MEVLNVEKLGMIKSSISDKLKVEMLKSYSHIQDPISDTLKIFVNELGRPDLQIPPVKQSLLGTIKEQDLTENVLTTYNSLVNGLIKICQLGLAIDKECCVNIQHKIRLQNARPYLVKMLNLAPNTNFPRLHHTYLEEILETLVV